MAFFGVTIEELEKVWKHPNADLLDLAKLKGSSFQFVVQKDKWKPGMKCLYFPIDSLLPLELQKALGLEGRLSGKEKNRIKSVKLRGEISQGVVSDLSLVEGIENPTPEQVTEYLGVEKYEPPIIPCHAGQLVRLPDGLSTYDIEGCDRFEDIANDMMDMSVWISEKLEGSNFSVSLNDIGEFVNQRNHSIEQIEGAVHDYWKVTRELYLFDRIREIMDMLQANMVTLYGEFIGPGVQKNIYKLKSHTVRLFDLKIDGHFVDTRKFLELVNEDLRVPTLAEDVILSDWLGDKTIQEASNGRSILADIKREGIVIKPMVESLVPGIGRLVLKQRSPEYLVKSDL